MHTPPRAILVLTLLCSLALLLSAAVGTVVGLLGQEYFFAGFELVLVVSAVIGIFVGLGKFNQGPSIAIVWLVMSSWKAVVTARTSRAGLFVTVPARSTF